MRFPIAAVMFLVGSFIFFIFFAATSYIQTNVMEALDPLDDDLDQTYHDEITLLSNAFAVIASIFFVVGLLLIFILDSLSEEPEYYWRER